MNRRSFLMSLGAGMIGALVVRPSFSDYKLVSIHDALDKNPQMWYGGATGGGKSITMAEIVAAELKNMNNNIKNIFERDDKFYSMIKQKAIEMRSTRKMSVPIDWR